MTRHMRRLRGTSPAAAASLPDDDDLLMEILLRLPSQPSSLPRASAVCKRWQGLVTDPKFHRLFYAHHRKPPVLGVFTRIIDQGIVFNSILKPPDRIPPRRFCLGRYSGRVGYDLLDCRHGRILVQDRVRKEVIVCAPITGEQRRVSVPPEFNDGCFSGSVLCAADDLGHSGPFKVVLVSTYRRPTVCVYSSETGIWGDLISAEALYNTIGYECSPATLVRNALYWLCWRDQVIEFDLDGQRLAVIMGPLVSNDFLHGTRQIVQAEDGDVGFALMSHSHLQMWQRNVNGHGATTWVLLKIIEMHNILGISLQIGGNIGLMGYDEDNDVIFVYASRSVYVVQLASMHSKKLYGTYRFSRIYPFTSFYTPGAAINGGPIGAEMLHNT